MNGGSLEWLFLVVEVIMYENSGFLSFQSRRPLALASGRVPSAGRWKTRAVWSITQLNSIPA